MERQSNIGDLTEINPFNNPLCKNGKAASQIVLVGTIHLDKRAAPRLFELLKSLRPDALAVEISRFSLEYRLNNQRRWHERLSSIISKLPKRKRKHLRIRLLKRQISMPYEWEISKWYSKKYGLPIFPIDICEISKKELPLWSKELITIENLDFLTSQEDMDIESYFNIHREKALRTLTDGPFPNPLVFDKNWCKRERHLAKCLLNLSLRYGKVCYIGGWMHLIDGKGIVTLSKYVRAKTIKKFLIAGNRIIEIKKESIPNA